MRVAFDTSVVVAASIAEHPDRARADPWLASAMEGELDGLISTHCLAELFATLSALPLEPRVPVSDVQLLVERLASGLQVCELTRDDYTAAMSRCSERGLRSGRVYDALHLVAAERQAADVFLTFNVRDFTALGSHQGPPRVTAPPDPPRVAVG